MTENNLMGDQLYKLRQERIKSGGFGSPSDEKDSTESQAMVDLLKRNHDTMLQKYEQYRQRNEVLEKSTLDKEALYLKIKTENDHLVDQLYGHKRISEDYKQENAILKTKLQSQEQLAKTNGEQATALKISKEKFEGQLRSVTEQLEMVTRSNEQLVEKKSVETELFQREINTLNLRDRD